jgi:hypothetical protein
MSEPGLYTNLYVELRDCAELLDSVIIDLEGGGGTIAQSERATLASILRSLKTAPASSLRADLLATLLRESRTIARADWTEVADAVERGEASNAVIGHLEALARALETERAEIHARIHGPYAR